MGFENTTNREVPQEAIFPPREELGVYVPVLLSGQRILTEENGMLIKGTRLERTTSAHDAHFAAGRRGIPTKTVARLTLPNDTSRFINGIVELVKPVHGYTIDLEKHNLEIHDYASLQAHYAAIRELVPAGNPDFSELSSITELKRQAIIVRALAAVSLRI